MMQGFAQRRLDRMSWEIALYDGQRHIDIQFTFQKHEVVEGMPIRVTEIQDRPENMEMLRALAGALQQMGLFPDSATQTELKATKFHLEDMRSLVFKPEIIVTHQAGER